MLMLIVAMVNFVVSFIAIIIYTALNNTPDHETAKTSALCIHLATIITMGGIILYAITYMNRPVKQYVSLVIIIFSIILFMFNTAWAVRHFIKQSVPYRQTHSLSFICGTFGAILFSYGIIAAVPFSVFALLIFFILFDTVLYFINERKEKREYDNFLSNLTKAK